MSLHIIEHPLVHDALMELRDVATVPSAFRRAATASACSWPPKRFDRCPPLSRLSQLRSVLAHGRVVRADIVVVPVLRAGLSMLEPVLQLVPSARVGHIGLQRDESTAVASRYYSKLPVNPAESHVLMVDPMLATAGAPLPPSIS